MLQFQRQVLRTVRPVGAVEFFDVADTLEVVELLSLVDFSHRREPLELLTWSDT
jgi:hypothetical protein